MSIDEKDDIESSKIIYRKYLAVKQCFDKDFDYWKYNGLSSSKTANGLENKLEFYRCLGLYRKYKKLEVIEKVLVISAFHNHKFWLGDIDHEKYTEYRRLYESQDYLLGQQEIKKHIFVDSNYNRRFNTSNDYKYTEIYSLYKKNCIGIYSLIVLNHITGVLDRVYKQYPDDFIFVPDYKRIVKFQKFVMSWKDIDNIKFLKLLKQYAEEAKDF